MSYEQNKDPFPQDDNLAERRVVLETRKLSISYAGNLALRDVSFTICAAEITAIIGPSGSGKSSLLRCFNRMIDLVEGAEIDGEVLYHGQSVRDPRVDPVNLRRRMGMIFQRPNPFPKSIYDNVAYGPRIQGKKQNLDDTVEEALTQAALWDEVKNGIKKKSAIQLSGGQQQRLCIARAIAVHPEVLLMDEPCASLDPIATAKIEAVTTGLANKGCTIVIVTHNMQQATRISDRTAFFDVAVEGDGSHIGYLAEYDTREKLFTNPVNPRTEAFITGRFG